MKGNESSEKEGLEEKRPGSCRRQREGWLSREKQRCQVLLRLSGFWDTGAMAGIIQERARTTDGKKLEVGRTFRLSADKAQSPG